MKLIVTDSLIKPSSLQREYPELKELVCASNEKPSFIVLVDSNHAAVRLCADGSVSLGISTAENIRIAVDSPFECKIMPLAYFADNDGNLYADMICEGMSLEYSGLAPAAALCDISLPQNAVPGEYTVRISLFSSHGLRKETKRDEYSLKLKIKESRLPELTEGEFFTDIWQQPSNIARTFGVELFGSEHFELLDKLMQKLSELNQKSLTVMVSDCPWRGWGCYLLKEHKANLFEYSIVKTIRKEDGSFDYDFSALDEYIRLGEKHGIDGDITLYGLLGIWKMPFFESDTPDWTEAIAVRCLDEKSGAYFYLHDKEDISAYIKALFSHLKDKGVWERVRIGADEPADPQAFAASAKALWGIEPSVKLKIAVNKPEIVKALGDMAHTIAYSFACAATNSEKKGERKLWYVCNEPVRPNTNLNNTLLETALLPLLNLKFGCDGFLRWASTCWNDTPLTDIRFNVNSLPAGDTCLLYPAKKGGFAESLRFRALVCGIRLYEAFKRIDEDKAHALLAALLNADEGIERPDKTNMTADINVFRQTYDKLLDYLSGGVS